MTFWLLFRVNEEMQYCKSTEVCNPHLIRQKNATRSIRSISRPWQRFYWDLHFCFFKRD